MSWRSFKLNTVFDLHPFHESRRGKSVQSFRKRVPDIATKLNELVDAQRASKVLDAKTKQLINIAIQTANRNPRGVFFHAQMAKQELQEKKS